MRRSIYILAFFITLILAIGCDGSNYATVVLLPTSTVQPTEAPAATNTPIRTQTAAPTETPAATNTPTLTQTATPTETPNPTDTPTPSPAARSVGKNLLVDLNTYETLSPLTNELITWAPQLFYSVGPQGAVFCPGHNDLVNSTDGLQIGPDGCGYTTWPGCLRPNTFDGNDAMDISPYPFGTSHCVSRGAPIFSLATGIGRVWNSKDMGEELGAIVNIWHRLGKDIELYDGTVLPRGTEVYIHYGHLDRDRIIVKSDDRVAPGDLIGYVNTTFGTWEFGVSVFSFYSDGSDLSIDPVLLGMSFPGSHDPQNP